MGKFIRQARTLLLMATVAAVAALYPSGCSKKPAQEPPTIGAASESEEETPDAPPDTGTFADGRDSAAYKTSAARRGWRRTCVIGRRALGATATTAPTAIRRGRFARPDIICHPIKIGLIWDVKCMN